MAPAILQSLPIVLVVCGLALAAAALGTRLSTRFGVPTSLAFTAVGMLVGSQTDLRERLVGLDAAYAVGNVALALILFHGGLGTDLRRTRGVWLPSMLLATVGVVAVTLVTAGISWLLFRRILWGEALLLGAVLGSTDAASVLQVLGNERMAGRVRETVELESGLNDPMAFVLVAAFTPMALGGSFDAGIVSHIAWEMLAGAGIGLAIGWASDLALAAFEEDSPEVYPVITVALALLSYGAASMAGASGLLAVFMTALTLGNSGDLPFRSTISRFHSSLAYLAQIVMFFVLGVLVVPQTLARPELVAGGVVLAAAVAFVSRPVAVAAILLPMGYSRRETAAVAWLGLRGAVPIILMTIPLLSIDGAREHDRLTLGFGLVFVCVVVGSFIPGSTVRWSLRLLRLRLPPAPRPSAMIELVTKTPLDTRMVMLVVQPGAPIEGTLLADARIPGEITVALLVRGPRTQRVRGDTRFEAGDEVALSLPERMIPVARQLFGDVHE
jgi:cell volume regulation protein A